MTIPSESFLIELQDKELISIDIVEKEIIKLDIFSVDTLTGLRKNISEFDDVNISNPLNGEILVYQDGKWINSTFIEIIETNTIYNETPTPNPPVTEGDSYTTEFEFLSNTLRVYLNGIKLSTNDFTILSSKTFSIGIDTIITDSVSVDYVKA